MIIFSNLLALILPALYSEDRALIPRRRNKPVPAGKKTD
jgi:hypothetical protein